MSNDNSEANENMEVPFPSEAELFAAGYVRILTDEDLLARGFVPIDFKNMPAAEDMTTAVGHPFPQHHEITQAGYIPYRDGVVTGKRGRVRFGHGGCRLSK